MPSLPPRMKNFPILAKNSWKVEIEVFLLDSISYKLEFVSNIPWRYRPKLSCTQCVLCKIGKNDIMFELNLVNFEKSNGSFEFHLVNRLKTNFLEEFNFWSCQKSLYLIFFLTQNLLEVALPFKVIQTNDLLTKKKQ